MFHIKILGNKHHHQKFLTNENKYEGNFGDETWKKMTKIFEVSQVLRNRNCMRNYDKNGEKTPRVSPITPKIGKI